MALTLASQLAAARTALKALNSGTLIADLRDAYPFDPQTGEYALPTEEPHVILDVIPGAPIQTMSGAGGEDLMLQAGVWHPTGITAALTLAKTCSDALIGLDYEPSGGTQIQRDGNIWGVVRTYSLGLAFEDIT